MWNYAAAIDSILVKQLHQLFLSSHVRVNIMYDVVLCSMLMTWDTDEWTCWHTVTTRVTWVTRGWKMACRLVSLQRYLRPCLQLLPSLVVGCRFMSTGSMQFQSNPLLAGGSQALIGCIRCSCCCWHWPVLSLLLGLCCNWLSLCMERSIGMRPLSSLHNSALFVQMIDMFEMYKKLVI